MLKCLNGCDAPIHGVFLVNPHNGLAFGIAPRTYTDGRVRVWCSECGYFIGEKKDDEMAT